MILLSFFTRDSDRLCFHLLYRPEDEFQRRNMVLSNLPLCFLRLVPTSSHYELTASNNFPEALLRELLQDLGEQMIKQNLCVDFFYPKYLMMDFQNAESEFYKLVELRDGFYFTAGDWCDQKEDSVLFYYLSVVLAEDMFFFPTRFQREYLAVQRGQIERLNLSREVRNELLRFQSMDVTYFQRIIKRQKLFLYLVVEKDVNLLFAFVV